MLYKPAGLLTAAEDPAQPTVFSVLPGALRSLGCMPVGRLDKDTTGLLLLTTDGTLAHRLIAPQREVEKVYEAVVDTDLTETDVRLFRGPRRFGRFCPINEIRLPDRAFSLFLRRRKRSLRGLFRIFAG